MPERSLRRLALCRSSRAPDVKRLYKKSLQAHVSLDDVRRTRSRNVLPTDLELASPRQARLQRHQPRLGRSWAGLWAGSWAFSARRLLCSLTCEFGGAPASGAFNKPRAGYRLVL